MVLDSIRVPTQYLFHCYYSISFKTKVAEYYFELTYLHCPQYVEVQLTFFLNCNKPAFSLKIGIFKRFPIIIMAIKGRRMPISSAFVPRTCPTIMNYLRLISKSSKVKLQLFLLGLKKPGFKCLVTVFKLFEINKWIWLRQGNRVQVHWLHTETIESDPLHTYFRDRTYLLFIISFF